MSVSPRCPRADLRWGLTDGSTRGTPSEISGWWVRSHLAERPAQVKPRKEKAAALAVEGGAGLGVRLTVNLVFQVGRSDRMGRERKGPLWPLSSPQSQPGPGDARASEDPVSAARTSSERGFSARPQVAKSKRPGQNGAAPSPRAWLSRWTRNFSQARFPPDKIRRLEGSTESL